MDAATLYRTHAAEVHRFARYLTGDAALADDLTAEAFVRLWTAPGRITGSVKAYLLRAMSYRICGRCTRREKPPRTRRSLSRSFCAAIRSLLPCSDALGVLVLQWSRRCYPRRPWSAKP